MHISHSFAFIIALSLCLATRRPLVAQTAQDSAAVRFAALDYIEGWYAADAERMSRALHPELAKRIMLTDSLGNFCAGMGSG